ncbi:MAG TPA: YfhO family protein [Chitinophagaceae bacterium]|nr:YfhO family protein [Chitinophagaceae bacterium]
MKSSWFKKLIPHGVAVLIFLVVAFIYCKPVLEGKVVAQHDITHWKGSIQQSVEYAKTHNGLYPLWTNSMFSGMPTFQIGYNNNNKIPWIAHQIFSLGLPKPVNFFFLACICFYFLCITLRVRSVFGILGALAFAYATYNPIITAVGHDTKMLSIAYMPALLASVILIYEKKYWLGAGLTALFASVLIIQNHPQIDYYLFLTLGIMTIFYAIRWVKNKEWRHFGLAVSFTAIAAITGVLTNAVSIFSTYEYQKETIRGGARSIVDSTAKNVNASDGLTKDYALSYSMGITEPLIMMVPRMYGGASYAMEIKEEDSKALESLRAFPTEAQQQVSQYLSFYWGGMAKPGESVSGPAYVGAIICILAILAMFVLDGKHKWWILTAIGITIMMSWGSYFDVLNGFLYKALPLYNKFRAPSMILVVAQMLLPLLAVLGLNKIADTTDKKTLLPEFKKGLIAVAVTFILLFIIYFMSDFMSGTDNELMKRLKSGGEGAQQWLQIFTSFFEGLREDRKSLMMGDILRSLGFGFVALLLVFLAIRKTISNLVLGVGLLIFVLIDSLTIDVKYLNYESYKDNQENEVSFVKTKPDNEILADKSQFRVFNVAGDAFNENITSYYYNSVGGYHPAKIAIYQELIEHKLSTQQPNMYILNMLNTKYFIQKDRSNQTQAYQKNDSALGNCWLVKNIQYVKDANAEMNSLGNFNPADTAVVQDAFKSSIPFEPVADSTATIALVKNDNDVINYMFNAASNQFAVFSEIYYKSGWKAYIDGKETPIVKVNYVLRGLAVPAGKHDIKFEFKPQGYYKGRSITSIFSIVLLVVFAAGIFMEWRGRKETALANRV